MTLDHDGDTLEVRYVPQQEWLRFWIAGWRLSECLGEIHGEYFVLMEREI